MCPFNFYCDVKLLLLTLSFSLSFFKSSVINPSLISYEAASYGATSYIHLSWRAEFAFSSDAKFGWHAASEGVKLPQTVFVTFPEKREIVRISFQLRKDYIPRFDVPTDFQILATNEAIPLPNKPDGRTDIDGVKWSMLAHSEGVEWASKDAVFTMEISRCNVGRYHTYGISILKTKRGVPSGWTISRVKIWGI